MTQKNFLWRIVSKPFRHRRQANDSSPAQNIRPGSELNPDTKTLSPSATPASAIPTSSVAHVEPVLEPAPIPTFIVTRPIDKGPNLGLQVLYNPPSGLPTAVDIIFVHGLTGNAYNTWCSNGKLKIHWPSELLRIDIPDARILSFGYDADVVGWCSPASKNRVGNHAENLLGSVIRFRERTASEERSIIFIMHSLGGLVVQNALDLSRASPEAHLRKLELNTLGLLFMGTPHFGSDKARWGSFCTTMVGVVKTANRPIVNVLKPDSEMLGSIQKKFHEILT